PRLHGVEVAVDRLPADPQAVVGAVVVVPFAVGPDAAVDDQGTAPAGGPRHRPAAVVELEGEVADRLPPAVEAQVQAQARPAGQPPAGDDPAGAPRPAGGPLAVG